MQKREGNIKVFCRFRPFNQKQENQNPTKIHRISNKKQLIVKDMKAEEISFMYDYVFDIDSNQEEVFEQVGYPVLNNIVEGFNGTIMAYGQTSSGKTHTMQGYDMNDKEAKGIMPRMIEKLFSSIEKSPDSIEFKLKISIFQIYKEKVRDLLDISKNDLKIRQNKQGCYVQNLTEVYVSDKHELFKIIIYGQKNRATCATNMNEHSSRSHLIFQLSINQFNNLESSSKTSKLFLIDLAGSQKISKTGAEGNVLQQAKKINLSLTNLGKVIKALSEKGTHIPYRDSKLTRILKDSLGGNSKTTLIVTCSPHQMHLPQSLSTLRFGQNAQKVKNKPKINRQLTIQQLQKIIEKMQIDVNQKDIKIKKLQFYITDTLKSQLPKQIVIKISEKQQDEQSSIILTSQMNNTTNEQTQQRIKKLEEQIESSQSKLKNQMQKYYHLKKQYNQLHDNLTSIIKQNIQLQEQLDEKKKKSIFSQKSIQNNHHLIKLIVGEIMNYLEKEKLLEISKNLQKSYWYQKIMIDGVPCNEYWQIQKNQMNRQLEQLMNESKSIQIQKKYNKQEENRSQRDNQKIIQLEKKIGEIYSHYNTMLGLQTSWKAECQLYERTLKNKEQKILKLEKALQEMNEQIQGLSEYEQDDKLSVRSKIIKPLKGGFRFC